jgi:uncharacterized protein YgiM (DUF1202 family)
MKRIFILSGIASLIVLYIFLFQSCTESQAKGCCGGRCTGSSYCTACTNCTRCAHCNSGGSCGVCAAPVRTKTTTYEYKEKGPSTKTKGSTGTSENDLIDDNSIYSVTSSTVNVRSGPSTQDGVITTLKYGDEVRVIEFTNEKWVKIETTVINDSYQSEEITGYVFKQYIKKQ